MSHPKNPRIPDEIPWHDPRHPPLVLWPKAYSKPRVKGIDLPHFVGSTVTLVGWPITAKPVLTCLEEPMEFVSFEDETALYETVLFPLSALSSSAL